MRYKFAVVFLITICYANAQIVNIPDANFKAALMGYDINGDGEIQETEAAVVTDIYLTTNNVTDVTGIRSFVNLKNFTCWNNQLTSLDVSGLSSLETLTCDNNLISIITLTGCTKLNFLACSTNKLITLDVTPCDSLERLVCEANPLLATINGHANKKLKYVYCGLNPIIENLILTDCDSLATVSFPNSNIQTLNISGSQKIQRLWDFGSVENLLAKNCTGLTEINTGFLSGIGVGNFLDVTGCTNLQTIYIQENGMQTLDVSSCINLKNLSLPHGNYNFQYLNIKNGSSLATLDLGNVSGIPGLVTLNICADDFEMNTVNNQLVNYGKPFVTTSNCSFFPGGIYNTITGKTRLDRNNNGCDNSDAAMPQVPIRISDALGNSLVRYSTTGGNYAHYPYKGVFTLTPYFPYPYFSVNPVSSSVSFDTANNLTATRDFCITPNGTHNDLEITFLTTFPPARPGFNAGYTITYKNRGTTTLSGNVQLNFDNNKMNFVSASENVATQSTGQVTWNYNNLQPFESKTINVTFNLLPPPVNNIGDTINYLAAITPSATDETQFDNSFILPQRVTGSYDPNDKQCLEGSKLDISQIGDYLHYQIRFQNEGTDTAFNVVVADTLSDKLDWNTFEFIKASHTADVQLTNNRLEFFFQNINLPYKAINEPASNGWVAFKIKPKPSVVIGDSLNNSAAIYFDFNLPVITNTATTIVSNSSSPVPVKLEYFSINKKESSNQLNWKASCTSTRATFVIERSDDGIHPIAIGFKSIGNISATALRCQLPFNFTDNNPINGKNYYRIKITDAEGKSFYSKVLVAGNNKAGIEITAVANNTVYISSNKQQTLTMKVIAGDGKEIMNAKQYIPAGNNTIGLKIGKAAKGIYTLVVYTDDNIISKKFVQ